MLDSPREAFHTTALDMAGSESERPANDPLIGTVLAGRYRVDHLIGSGAMGAVYRAEHVHIRKTYAVKVLHREMTQLPEVVARFEREAVAAGRIAHPNVAAATDFGRHEDGTFFLVLEFAEGHSLSHRIAHERILSEARALSIGRQIADALSAAHAAGVVHRDLKPDNVMLVDKDGARDFVKVLDFGIAKLESTDPSQAALTRLNTVMGTPEYMAPEQARGEPVDARADLYTLGVIFYEMLAGTTPFRADDFVVVLTRKLTEEPAPLPDTVSRETAELVLALLRRSPAERPESAALVLAHLDAILARAPLPLVLPAPRASGLAAAAPSSRRTRSETSRTLAGEAASVTGGSGHGGRARRAPRSVMLAGRAIPVSWLLLVILGLATLGVLLVRALVPGVSQVSMGQGKTVDVPTSLSRLMERAESGDVRALAELGREAEISRSGAAFRALGHGYFKAGKLDAGLRAYGRGGAFDPELARADDVLTDVARAARSEEPALASLALEVAGELGAPGADLIFSVWEAGKSDTDNAAVKRARSLLDSDTLHRRASPALAATLDLGRAKADGCPAIKKALPRVVEVGDARAVPLLNKLKERRGCGFLGLADCFTCLRSGKDVANALKAASARPAPKPSG